jgi:glycosyltransferase involved in cell wall biosynthesis
MKLLVSAYACAPNRGSEPGFGWNWTLELAKLGHHIWCFTTPKGRAEILKEMQSHHDLKVSFIFVDVPAWLNYLYRFQPFVYVHYIVWQRMACRLAIKVDKKEDFDAILHCTLGSLQLGSAMWRLKKPLIFGPVGGGNFPPKAFRKYFFSYWKQEVVRRYTSNFLIAFNPDTKKAVRNSKLILSTNRETFEMAQRMGACRVENFLDSGLPENFFPKKIPDRKKNTTMKILWVGRIFARKGLPVVLEALSKVNPNVPFRLTILGDGNLGHLVPNWVKEFGLQEKVDWRGQVLWEEVKKAYLEHDLFMFCSLRDSFGMQFLEAMAYGLPIITLNHQGAGDNIPDTVGIKVQVTDPDETTSRLAQAVEFLFENPEQRDLMGKIGSEFARTHVWRLKAQRMADYFEQLRT